VFDNAAPVAKEWAACFLKHPRGEEQHLSSTPPTSPLSPPSPSGHTVDVFPRHYFQVIKKLKQFRW
jgi:hypothetical protein